MDSLPRISSFVQFCEIAAFPAISWAIFFFFSSLQRITKRWAHVWWCVWWIAGRLIRLFFFFFVPSFSGEYDIQQKVLLTWLLIFTSEGEKNPLLRGMWFSGVVFQSTFGLWCVLFNVTYDTETTACEHLFLFFGRGGACSFNAPFCLLTFSSLVSCGLQQLLCLTWRKQNYLFPETEHRNVPM